MAKVLYLFLIVSLVACTPAGRENRPDLPAGTGRLVIDITGLRNDTGEIFLSLFKGPEGFPDHSEDAYVNRHEPITNRSCRIVIDNLPYGDYAVALLHDENMDGEMNTSLLGVPKEEFGFSGNPKAKFGQPSYDEVRFLLLVPEKHLAITVQHIDVSQERQRVMQERQRERSE